MAEPRPILSVVGEETVVHSPGADCLERIADLQALLEGHLLYLNVSCCGIVRSRSFWMVLEIVRIQWWVGG